mgnify:CR=1 FL=1
MKGSIRTLVGFMVAFGAVGTLDTDPNANVAIQFALALVGLAIMYTGVNAMKETQ